MEYIADPHEGHRDRLRLRVQEGLDGLEPHETMEWLLCHAIPRQDVNTLAHALIDHFGSVDPMVYAGMMEAYSEEGIDWVLALRQYVWENVLMLEHFMKENLPQARMVRPQGTFVAWVDYSAYEEIWSELDRVLREEGLFVGDGGEEYFGKNSYVRYSLAVPKAELKKTLERVAEALQARQQQ